MNQEKTPLAFHPFQSPVQNGVFVINPEVMDFANLVYGIYPRVYTEATALCESHVYDSMYTLRSSPCLSPHSIRSYPKISNIDLSLPLIAAPQHCDPTSIEKNPDGLIVEISPVIISFVGATHYCRMFELIEQDMSDDLALQFAYRITFIRNTKEGWSARARIIPYSLAKIVVEILRSGPHMAFSLFLLLLGNNLEDCEMLATIFKVDQIKRIAARVILEEHRTFFVGTFSNDKPVLTSPVYYYGCWDSRCNSYYLPDGDQLSSRDHDQLKELLVSDGLSIFTIGDRLVTNLPVRAEGQAHLLYMNGWTYLTFPNKSYDPRDGNHSDFFTQGIWDLDTMCRIARQEYPMIWKKLDERGIKVVLVS